MRAKILIQKLWQQDIDWDEPLSKAAEEEWLSIATDIQDAIDTSSITFPTHNPTRQTIKLHVFADASPRAYGAVAFICADNNVSFVMAKSRVAPLKQLSLPRLELMAALNATRLSKFIRDALQLLNITPYLWTDSQIVLHWLQSNKNLNTFVHHRVSEIHQLTKEATCNFCPTSDNPADLLTQGITSSQLKLSALWNHGPHWLTSISNWPTWQVTPALHLQALAITSATFTPKGKLNSTHGLHTVIDITNYSTLHKLTAVTAYVLRFMQHSMGIRHSGPLTTTELQQAKHMWIKNCQHQVFSKEVANLQCNPPTAKHLIGLTKLTLKKILGRARISLTTLQTLVVEVEAVLNDRPLTYVSSDITDSEPLTLSHLLYGRRISSLPYITVDEDEIDDPTYRSARDVDRRAKQQALTLQHFQRRWRDEYLTSLREFHQATGKNKQTIKVGDVVLVHDNTPQTMWKLAVIEELIRGNDGLVRAANIRTATGKTPLEVSSSTTNPTQHASQTRNAATAIPRVGVDTDETSQGGRPKRDSGTKGNGACNQLGKTVKGRPGKMS